MDIRLPNNKILICVFIILFYISRNNREYFKNKIFLKIFRRWHPWSKELIKSSNYEIILENESKNKNKKTITSILVSKTLYNLDNKVRLSKFLQNKSYYPKTYIYNKYNRYIPNNNDIWFVKNCSINTYGGKGISIVNNYDDLKKSLNLDNDFIIQKAITNLHLFNNIKGDIRMHYLIIYYKQKLSFYLYKEGHIKLAKESYDKNNINTKVQLTNVTQVRKNESSRCIIFSENYSDYNFLFPKIKYLLKDLSYELKKNHKNNYKSIYVLEYQLCGPDIIFDDNYNPYVLELNSNYPAYVMKKDIPEVKNMKTNIANILTKHLFEPAVQDKKIELEDYGFVKLL